MFGRTSLSLALLLGISGCATNAAPEIELLDPLGLMDVVGDLRILVFPAEGRGCASDGTPTPALSTEAGAVFEDATADLRFAPDEGVTLQLDEGAYIVHVRGRGTDPVSGREDQIVATGCVADVMITSGETRELTIELLDVVGEGECGDGVLSPDEQCEPGMGPLPCSASCQTESGGVHSFTEGGQSNPSVAFAGGDFFAIGFDSAESPDSVRLAYRSVDLTRIEAPASLQVDEIVDRGETISGAQLGVAVAMSSSRVGVAFGDFSTARTEGGDIRVRFFDENRSPIAGHVLAVPSENAQVDPEIAMRSNGETMVVFNDGDAASAVPFAAGSTEAGERVAIPGTDPVVAASGSGFWVSYVEGGTVRLATLGASLGSPFEVGAGASPAIAALSDGRVGVAWISGGQAQVQIFDASGSPVGETEALGNADAVSISAAQERFFIAFAGGGSVQAALMNGSGQRARNRQKPPTTDRFEVGSGQNPSVSASGDSVVVAWESGGDLVGRRFALP